MVWDYRDVILFAYIERGKKKFAVLLVKTWIEESKKKLDPQMNLMTAGVL